MNNQNKEELREEFKNWLYKKEKNGGTYLLPTEEMIADFWLSKREAEWKEFRDKIDEIINSEIKFDGTNNEFMEVICKGGLGLILQILDEKLK